MSDYIRASQSIELTEELNFGMVTLKANFSDSKIRTMVKSLTGIDNLPKPGKFSLGDKANLAWMSTDEYAVLLNHSYADGFVKKASSKFTKNHFLCLNMSDSRQCFKLKSPNWREVLAKGTPADVSPDIFKVGDFRRTRIASIAVAFWMLAEDEVSIICMRSVGSFFYEWLKNASSSQVGHFK